MGERIHGGTQASLRNERPGVYRGRSPDGQSKKGFGIDAVFRLSIRRNFERRTGGGGQIAGKIRPGNGFGRRHFGAFERAYPGTKVLTTDKTHFSFYRRLDGKPVPAIFMA